mmetsp:Transcript_40616/g.90308  ORF Transcript_40616/g.90308 Transcript_40616/m.90308 type:complete len:224 (-) Transcript_40616:1155-1826(-)
MAPSSTGAEQPRVLLRLPGVCLRCAMQGCTGTAKLVQLLVQLVQLGVKQGPGPQQHDGGLVHVLHLDVQLHQRLHKVLRNPVKVHQVCALLLDQLGVGLLQVLAAVLTAAAKCVDEELGLLCRQHVHVHAFKERGQHGILKNLAVKQLHTGRDGVHAPQLLIQSRILDRHLVLSLPAALVAVLPLKRQGACLRVQRVKPYPASSLLEGLHRRAAPCLAAHFIP